MSDRELLALMSATILAGDSQRSAAGAVAAARQLLDEIAAAEPEKTAAHVRGRITATMRQRTARAGQGG